MSVVPGEALLLADQSSVQAFIEKVPPGDRMIRPEPHRRLGITRAEFGVAGSAFVFLLIGEASMSTTIRGTHFAAVDGKMAEAVIRAAFSLAAPFDVTNLNHIQGVGSLLLPFNVWANPAYWPFAIMEGDRAAAVSGLIALACFATAVYVMARCFDLPALPSAVAAQSCIVQFGPLLLLASGTTVFALEPGFAVVYAPLMVALGVLSRIEPGNIGPFVLRTSILLLLVLYSIYSDPLWSVIGGISWSAAFIVVAFSPPRLRSISIRCASLGCCVVVLLASGVLETCTRCPATRHALSSRHCWCARQTSFMSPFCLLPTMPNIGMAPAWWVGRSDSSYSAGTHVCSSWLGW
jgi:hypothetical protein